MGSGTFTVRGIPKGQPRPRAFARKLGNGKFAARVFDPGTAEAWKSAIAEASVGVRPEVPVETPVAVTIVIGMPRPKALRRRKDPDGPIPHAAKPDADNLAKSVLDALTACGWWRDDSQVYRLQVEKLYCGKAERPGATVRVEWMPG